MKKPRDLQLTLGVYDDPAGRTTDDYTLMYFKSHPTASTTMCINTFEQEQANSAYEVKPRTKNGLDGKVSYVATQWRSISGTPLR